MMGERKRIVGFSPNGNSPKPAVEEKETKADYTRMALDQYLADYKPYNPEEDDVHCDYKTSKEIQNDLRDMVIAPISTITEYMVERGFKMVKIEGGMLAWHLQYDHPF